MNLIYDPYPNRVTVARHEYEIITDFKDWLRFVDMLKDPAVTEQDKLLIMLGFYVDDLPPTMLSMAYRPLIDFFSMKEAESTGANEAEEIPPTAKKALYDFNQDARYIIAGFWQDYRIDLTETNMHWWKFRILLDGLSEKTEFKQRVMYRNTNVNEIKDITERNRILRIQRSIAIKQGKPDDFEIGGMFW